jgi:hypothetical protein
MYFQIMFAMDRVGALAPKHPDWKNKQPFKAVLDRDIKALAALGETRFLRIMAVTHTGITADDFTKIVADWITTARHPRFDRPYTELVYQPMLELLSFLRANSFKTFIVSGGGVEFMRVFTERVYGIPPEQVVGSSGVVRYRMQPNYKPVLIKEGKIEFVDDGPGKPVGINRFIGKRPVFAFGLCRAERVKAPCRVEQFGRKELLMRIETLEHRIDSNILRNPQGFIKPLQRTRSPTGVPPVRRMKELVEQLPSERYPAGSRERC